MLTQHDKNLTDNATSTPVAQVDGPVITYYFEDDDLETRAFEVSVNRPMVPREGRARWTRLSHHQCSNCPLRPETFPHCPAAVDIELIVESFSHLLAHERLRTIVMFPDGRELRMSGPTDQALAGVLGLIMASCPCPILSRLKGMALTHNPFLPPEQIMVRYVGSYLTGQYLEHINGKPAQWSLEGFKAFCKDIEIVNTHLIARLAAVGPKTPALESIRLLLRQSTGLRDMVDSWDEQLALYALPALTEADHQTTRECETC